ncbi:transposase [Methylocaldum marinum]|uniref:transposase n=1 Tax=Methylocaldum marinum TaxID=1432792 RepID=UPI000E6867A7
MTAVRWPIMSACDHGQVTFRYRNSKTRHTETRILPGASLRWLLLQRVLPKRFRRVLEAVKARPVLRCPGCGGLMTIVRTRTGHRSCRASPPLKLQKLFSSSVSTFRIRARPTVGSDQGSCLARLNLIRWAAYATSKADRNF